ncbi:MAG: hypothetical protein S4CHLAM102_04400 [Chlamydiia bacterium]|nr:hypothetical protein [Chlamydiia bacterium]
MTLGNADHAEADPFEYSFLFDCLAGVGAAGRIEATLRSKHGADKDLIEPNGKGKKFNQKSIHLLKILFTLAILIAREEAKDLPCAPELPLF